MGIKANPKGPATVKGAQPNSFDPTANRLVQIIQSENDSVRNQSLDLLCAEADFDRLIADAEALDIFWRATENLYHRVRALFFLSAIYRFHLPKFFDRHATGNIPFGSYRQLLGRRFVEAIDSLLDAQSKNGANDALSSALAQSYRELAFQTLADQVRRSVRTVPGNQWMFRTGHPADHPIRFRPELMMRPNEGVAFPILKETTAVRMDFTHSGWSDIFFLGMDYPSGARVINASINLGVMDRDASPAPPIECYLRVIDRPVLKLVSIDLKASAEISTIGEVFDFARDYLGLLKAAVIASGIVPPGMEGCGQNIESLLKLMIGPELGLEIVSKVNDIPKGSRLAVSTNLLGSLISLCMRATGQVSSFDEALAESDRRIVAARAILGEWIGGSGGGWQDSGGVWPGIKLIQGSAASEGDPEHGISRGRLLPKHSVFTKDEISPETRKKLQDSLVLVHGGMAQNVGPIITEALKKGDIKAVGAATHRNFFGPLQKIIPWCTNLFTNSLVQQVQQKYGDKFWGFWMLGGMAGGGMGFIFDPTIKPDARKWLQSTMSATKKSLEKRLPFAMEPVVYNFEINDRGTWGELLKDDHARMSAEYYALMIPGWLKLPPRELSALCRVEMELLGSEYRNEGSTEAFQKLVEGILPGRKVGREKTETLNELLQRIGFDRDQHEQVRTDLKSGRYGLAQNRLPVTTCITDVEPSDVVDSRDGLGEKECSVGEQAIVDGKVAVVTLSAGVGSRWTKGAGVVKGLHPFSQFAGKHRSFIEVHLAKSRLAGNRFDRPFPHIITTGYMTHQAIEDHLKLTGNYNYPGEVLLSPGRYIGLRTVPMEPCLWFATCSFNGKKCPSSYSMYSSNECGRVCEVR